MASSSVTLARISTAPKAQVIFPAVLATFNNGQSSYFVDTKAVGVYGTNIKD